MRRFKRIIYGLLIIYIVIGSSLYLLQERLIFLPTTLPQDYTYTFDHPFEELFLNADDGAVINAIHFKSENPKGVILYFHGNAGNLSRWGQITEFFVERQYDLLVMDYRSYGKSTGELSEQAFYNDAQLCYDHLLKDYKATEIIIYGRSLGTGMATYLASKQTPGQLILETPFYSLTHVAKYRFPLFPAKTLLKYKFPSYKYIPEVTCPITIFHGTDDRVIPYASGQRLFESITHNDKVFYTVESGGHNDLVTFESYREGITQILP